MEILDSGVRRQFETGAVRDSADGRGRCDLLPLDIIGEYLFNSLVDDSQGCVYDKILNMINEFIRTGDTTNIYSVIDNFIALNNWSPSQALIEVSKHYEEGAKKYAERNWEKGIPCHCYVDSGVRHFLKWIDKWDDEPHDRAFLWNMLGLLWTIRNKPELNDLPYVNNIETEFIKIKIPEGPRANAPIPPDFPINN